MSRLFPWTSVVVFFALLTLIPAGASAQAPRPVDAVFPLAVARNADGGLTCTWRVTPGHYLYRDRISVRTDDGRILPLTLPAGEKKSDPNFGTTQVYHASVAANLAEKDLPATGALHVAYQGCAEHGVCYPPVVKRIDLATLAMRTERQGFGNPPASVAQPTPAPAKPEGSLAATLRGGLPSMLLAFLGFGLLLAFTPCVFPMVPILSGMLASSGEKLSARRGVVLSGSYVLAMALAYAVLGLVAAWSGQNLQVFLQQPVTIGGMSLIFVVLALSMFGLFDLTLPTAWTSRLSRATAHTHGSVGGAALLGFGSALIVGPCVTPPLAAALLYVAQTGDVFRGAAALFSLGLGMGLPLLVFGLFGGKLLPKAGAWLITVKQIFGFIFLGLAIWMLGRVLPATVTRALWGAVAVVAGLWFGLLQSRGYGMRVLGGSVALGGAILIMSAVGLLTLSCPLEACREQPAPLSQADLAFFRKVTTPAAFEAALSEAQAKGQPILVDFTANWCVVCREIDQTVLADPAIRSRLQNVSVIRADISEDSPEGRALMQRFDVVGPPTMLFVNAHTGQEIAHTRSVGAVTTDQFSHTLAQAGA